MIVANRKSIKEILEMIEGKNKIMVVGCKGCVTVCNVGGLKEVQVLASSLKIARKHEGKPITIEERLLERQCDPEYVEQLKEEIGDYEAVVSLACGVGPQFLSEMYPNQTIFPGVNTTFYGGAVSHGVWEERCAGCGTCVIHNFGGMCPIARCSKSLLNGPCGGSANGLCEVNDDIVCVWDLIVKKKMAENQIDDLLKVIPSKDWRTAREGGGPRKRVRDDLTKAALPK